MEHEEMPDLLERTALLLELLARLLEDSRMVEKSGLLLYSLASFADDTDESLFAHWEKLAVFQGELFSHVAADKFPQDVSSIPDRDEETKIIKNRLLLISIIAAYLNRDITPVAEKIKKNMETSGDILQSVLVEMDDMLNVEEDSILYEFYPKRYENFLE